jgi:serine/threonine-protein kinase
VIAERWRQIEALCHATLAQPIQARAAFLARACAGDAALQREVESLLAGESSAEGFMSVPAAPVALSEMLDHPHGTLVGRRLGSFAVGSLLGVGGMGDVYRAHDDTLDRDVAIKVLPPAFTADPERRARLEREARLLATLNHPHIGAIYGVHVADDFRALVLELVEGETLAERIARAPDVVAPSGGFALALADALAIAGQIADALDAAHEKGIVHRDLKPTNIKITPEGVVKVLDFGLAKAAGSDTHADLPESRVGVILGTPAYMSPEQARGQSVDKRSDVWAFGCVLYEMLSGRLAFPGGTASDIIAKILEREPDWSALPAATPAPIRHVLLRCLTKDLKRRLRDIGDVRTEIEAVHEPMPGDSEAVPTSMRPATDRNAWLLAAMASALGFGLALALVSWAPWRTVQPSPPLRLSAELGADASLASLNARFGDAAILSPDGAVIAFVAQQNGGGRPELYVRRLDELRATRLPDTEDALAPFFSPDGQWIGFFASNKLKKVPVMGGAVVTLADALSPRGGTWGEDQTIVFSPNNQPGTRLQRVSAAGGTSEPLTPLAAGELLQLWPQLLPGGKAVLYTSSDSPGAYDAANLVVQSWAGGTSKVVYRGGYHARYLPSGHLVFIHAGTLFAAPFDLTRLEMIGEPAPALEGVRSNSITGGAQFAVSAGGTLVYLPGPSIGAGVPIHLMNRDGKSTPLAFTPVNWLELQFAPDGHRLAMQIREKSSDIWVYDLRQETLARVTQDPGRAETPVWTVDGRGIVFASARAGGVTPNLYVQRADGTGAAVRLTNSPYWQRPASWHPSGRFLAFEEVRQANVDIQILPIDGDDVSSWKAGTPKPFLNGPFLEAYPMFSPDGRWLAYSSNETGRAEVYVRPFPVQGGPSTSLRTGKWQVSTGGGTHPTWSRAKHELFYGLDGAIFVAPYAVEGDSFRAEKPRLWSEGHYQWRGTARMFDVHPDGERFALALAQDTPRDAKPDKIVFVFNFFDELRRIAPATRQP